MKKLRAVANEPLDVASQLAVREKIEELGEAGALAFFGLSRPALVRALAALPIFSGTACQIRAALQGDRALFEPRGDS